MAALGPMGSVMGQEKEVPGVVTNFSKVPEGWLVGLERALKVAKATEKDLLLSFAGSDWIPPSIDLEERVLSKKEFAEEAMEEFVLVRLDFPRTRNVQSEELQRENLAATSAYEVTAYPTVILADSEGRPYARTGWANGISVESFLKRLQELQELRRQRDAHLQAAAEAEGEAKVERLVKALEGQSPAVILKFYEPEFRQIEELDPENYGGLGEVAFYDKSLEMRTKLDALAEKDQWAEAIEALDAFGEAHAKTPQQKQQIEFFKLNGLLQLKRLDEIMPFLDRVIAMDPESAVGKKAASVKPELMRRIAEAMKLERRQAKEDEAPKTPDSKAPEGPGSSSPEAEDKEDVEKAGEQEADAPKEDEEEQP